MSVVWGLVVLLVVLWALGFFVVNLGSIVHILLVLALIAIIWNVFAGSRGSRRVL